VTQRKDTLVGIEKRVTELERKIDLLCKAVLAQTEFDRLKIVNIEILGHDSWFDTSWTKDDK
jgi:hypothetical protein